MLSEHRLVDFIHSVPQNGVLKWFDGLSEDGKSEILVKLTIQFWTFLATNGNSSYSRR